MIPKSDLNSEAGPNVAKYMKMTIGGGAALLALMTVLGGFYTVDQTERGVVLRNGKFIATADPGLNFKIPFFDHVKKISVKTAAARYNDVISYSRDQQSATLAISVNYHIPPEKVGEVYATYETETGMVNALLDRKVYDQVKIIFGQYNAVTAISDRDRMVGEMQDAVRQAVAGPIVIDSLQLENIDFSDAYEGSIEDRMKAEVRVQEVRQNAEREKIEAEIVVIKAKAQADSQLALAQAGAQAIKLKGEAEADAIRNRAAALGQNPNLIALTQAEKWDGKLPTTMVPQGAMPFIDVGAKP